MFEQLETMVQNLGNNYIATRNNNVRKIEYNPNDSDTNLNGGEKHPNQAYNTIYAKCEYLETLNSNLVEENKKLKQKTFQPKENFLEPKMTTTNQGTNFDLLQIKYL